MMRILSVTFLLSILLTACDSGTSEPIAATTVTNLAADVARTGHYTFYDLKTNQTVALADSNSTKWDIAFKNTSIIINSGVSGPGNVEAQVVSGVFAELLTAPETGYQKDLAAANLAIKPGSGNGWYNYNATAMTINPIPGKLIVLKTTDGKFAKIQIKSYYQNAPATPDINSVSRYYTFDYVYQPNGSRTF